MKYANKFPVHFDIRSENLVKIHQWKLYRDDKTTTTKNYMRKKKTRLKKKADKKQVIWNLFAEVTFYAEEMDNCQDWNKFSLLYFEVVVPIFLGLEMISFLNYNEQFP